MILTDISDQKFIDQIRNSLIEADVIKETEIPPIPDETLSRGKESREKSSSSTERAESVEEKSKVQLQWSQEETLALLSEVHIRKEDFDNPVVRKYEI